MKEIQFSDTYALALGAGILGTGGGGNTYLGRIWLQRELNERKVSCRVIDAEEVDDNALVCAIGTMGAPTVAVEKMARGDEFGVFEMGSTVILILGPQVKVDDFEVGVPVKLGMRLGSVA